MAMCHSKSPSVQVDDSWLKGTYGRSRNQHEGEFIFFHLPSAGVPTAGDPPEPCSGGLRFKSRPPVGRKGWCGDGQIVHLMYYTNNCF